MMARKCAGHWTFHSIDVERNNLFYAGAIYRLLHHFSEAQRIFGEAATYVVYFIKAMALLVFSMAIHLTK